VIDSEDLDPAKTKITIDGKDICWVHQIYFTALAEKKLINVKIQINNHVRSINPAGLNETLDLMKKAGFDIEFVEVK
jgi:hypothetical protein